MSSEVSTSRNFVSSGSPKRVFVNLQSSSALRPLSIIVVCSRRSVVTVLTIDLMTSSPVRDLWNTIMFFLRSVFRNVSSRSSVIFFHSSKSGVLVGESAFSRSCDMVMIPLIVSLECSQLGFDSSNCETSNCG